MPELIPQDFIDDLVQRIDVVEVIGNRIDLIKKAGKEYKGLCPFHTEKTPSFTVSRIRVFIIVSVAALMELHWDF